MSQRKANDPLKRFNLDPKKVHAVDWEALDKLGVAELKRAIGADIERFLKSFEIQR